MNLRLIVGFLVAGFLPGAEPLFESSIEPLLRTRCWQCHGEVVQLGRLKLSSREAMLAGGEHGVVIVPGSLNRVVYSGWWLGLRSQRCLWVG